MGDNQVEDLYRRLVEDRKLLDLDAMRSLQDRLRRYVGTPGVAEESSRTAVREDLVISAIADLLESHPRPEFRILDACCGLGGLALHLAKNLGDRADRVVYLGIDQNFRYVNRARKLAFETGTLGSVDFRIGEVWRLPTEWGGGIDLVVLGNTLHELPPSRFPELFEAFNNVITADVGRVCVIDMEELPAAEPEAGAINWRLEEVEAFLTAAGFAVAPSNHPKSVGVFRVVVKRAERIDREAMLKSIKSRLRGKLDRLLQGREVLPEEPYKIDALLLEWIIVTGSIARCAEELLLVERRLEALAAAAPPTTRAADQEPAHPSR